ncbi:MAG: CocE/NonD family hydrolase [Steroidobacteraceae bacterium]
MTYRILLAILYLAVAPCDPAGAQSNTQEKSTAQQINWPAELARYPKSNREMMEKFLGQVPGPDFTQSFDKEIVRIRMRDGAELHTEIYRPKAQAGFLPIIYEPTPYGIIPDKHGYTARLRWYPELIKDSYIFVFQDRRGRGASSGRYVTAGPMRNSSIPNSTDDSTDAFDSIDWLVRNVRGNNGRVGTLGISYGGFLTTRALVNPHPALKAASPQATCADMFIGDDWHHNGAFRLEYSFSWIGAMEAGVKSSELLMRYDNYERFLELGPLSNVNRKILHGKAPSWNAFTQHPNLDEFWRTGMCGVLPYIQPVTVPTLNVLGWFDAEDFYGALEAYKKYESLDGKGLNYLVIGPWYHGGWTFSPDGRVLGTVDFGSNTSEWFRDKVQARWFAYWLKDQGSLDFPEVMAFRTGENRWERYDSWPARSTTERRLYLRAKGTLSFERPVENGTGARDDYISDPDKPVPHYPRPITYLGWPEWQLADQRFVDGRPDVLTYESEPLTEDLAITGDAVAHLFAATSGSDSDWIVKLIDVYPQNYAPDQHLSGFQLMVAGEVFRARYRNSFERPEPVTPGKVTAYRIHLRDRNHTFKAGHSIMVQIQSSWFPMIDRNPQRYVPNIYEATEADFKKATQSIYRSAQFASHISLPVNGRAVEPLPPALRE